MCERRRVGQGCVAWEDRITLGESAVQQAEIRGIKRPAISVDAVYFQSLRAENREPRAEGGTDAVYYPGHTMQNLRTERAERAERARFQ